MKSSRIRPENHDLHGSAPDQSRVCLVLIDVINPFDFLKGMPNSQSAAEDIVRAYRNILALSKACRKRGVPVIYANDNFGRWRSSFEEVYGYCSKKRSPPASWVKKIRPTKKDYIVLKPKHSIFYATPLDLLLHYLGAKELILAGFLGNMCVLYSAMDAYMREFRIYAPSDCVVSCDSDDNRWSLLQMEGFLKANIAPAHSLSLSKNGVTT